MKREMASGGRWLSVTKLAKVPRKGEYKVELSDGYRFRVTAEQVFRFGLDTGKHLDAEEIPELERAYEAATARKVALRLLKTRPRTGGELKRELIRRKYRAEAIGSVLADLESAGFVDDRLFARLWVKERIEKKGFGRRRIAAELLSKGVGREIVEEEIEAGFDREDEAEVAERAARVRLRRLQSVPLETMKRRIYTYLLRNGFSSDIASEATRSVMEIFGGDDADDNE
jgi:regulatory protein